MDVPRSDCGGYDRARQNPAVSAQQLAAAASPDRATRDLVGNFADFEMLFEQLGEPVVLELGNPLPDDKFMPRKRAGSCHATHNEALLREDGK